METNLEVIPSFLLEGIRLNLLIKDLVIFNVLSLVAAIILFLLGRSLIDAVSISLLIFCALLLISGGAIGFWLSSVSFERLQNFFGGKKESTQGQEKKKNEKRKQKLEQVNTGKRIILIGLILFGESLLISLVFILL
jgi:hypothetical protein